MSCHWFVFLFFFAPPGKMRQAGVFTAEQQAWRCFAFLLALFGGFFLFLLSVSCYTLFLLDYDFIFLKLIKNYTFKLCVCSIQSPYELVLAA